MNFSMKSLMFSSLLIFGMGLTQAYSSEIKANCTQLENSKKFLNLTIIDQEIRVVGGNKGTGPASNWSCDMSLPGDDQGEPRPDVLMYYLYCSNTKGESYSTYIGIPAIAIDGEVKEFKILSRENNVYSCLSH